MQTYIHIYIYIYIHVIEACIYIVGMCVCVCIILIVCMEGKGKCCLVTDKCLCPWSINVFKIMSERVMVDGMCVWSDPVAMGVVVYTMH